jgi:predicted permease
LFVAGLFVATFDRLAHQPTGFSADRILVLDTIAARKESPEIWEQVAEHLRSVRGVEKVALASRALLGGDSWNDSVSIDGGPPSDDLAYYMNVSPGWMDTMRIPLIAGRDFRPGDRYPGTAIVNETFAKRYYPGRNPIGRTFVQTMDEGGGFPLQIVGIAADSSYRSIREPVLAVVYVPFQAERGKREAAIVVRTSNAKPLSLASVLRREVPLARSEFRVSDVAAQQDINDSQTVRERLLATLAMFFGGVALLLAGVGLYGVLDYSVQQRRREIGIRIAIGARPARIARLVTAEAFVMVAVGAIGGVALGRASVRYIESLLFEVKPTSLGALTVPTVVILSAALLASLPALIRAVRIDPAATLRAD